MSTDPRASRVGGGPLRIAVLGTGRIGRLHAGLIAREVPDAQLAAVSDMNAAAAQECATEFGVPARHVDQILEDDTVDAVAVCSSTDTHVDLSLLAAKSGKAVFCEKPLSLDLARVDELLTVVEATGAPFMVGFNRRSRPVRSGTCIWSGSRREIRRRHRRSTSGSPAASSST